MRWRVKAAVVLGWIISVVNAQTWCGKNYKQGAAIVPPGGQFPVAASSSSPLLAFRCSQAIRPYVAGDGNDPNQPVSILIDAPVVYSNINNSQPITISDPSNPGSLSVTVKTSTGVVLTQGNVPINSNKTELPFSLSSLQPSSSAYTITCTATYNSQTFSATSLLTYLPSLPSGSGSVTKMDLRTGALLVRPANGTGSAFEPLFPIGFYTQFGYIAANLSIPAALASQGFNMIHLVPPYTDTTTLGQILESMRAAGLYAVYDMRFTYMNSTSIPQEVDSVKSSPNLLLWYTADEPDGTSDPLGATVTSSNLVTSSDGGDGQGGAGYHPVSLVLNCDNYFFTQYGSGADILLQDTYMIGNNVTWSTVWDTACTTDFGDCGCDDCEVSGSFQDISTRMDQFVQRSFVNGWERTKAVWTVPQAFGASRYWTRYPTGQEFVVQSIVGINHGAVGIVPWTYPTTSDIMTYSSLLATSLNKITPFILNPSASSRQITVNGVDCGIWTVGSQALVLATNTNYANETVTLASLKLPTGKNMVQVLDTGSAATSAQDGFTFTSVGSGGFIVDSGLSGSSGTSSSSSPKQTSSAYTISATFTPIVYSFLLCVVLFRN